MGNNASSVANVTKVVDDNASTADKSTIKKNSGSHPNPSSGRGDIVDKIASELPNIIDDESREQVNDYIEACDSGKGPMVACYATAEYLGLFERKYEKAADLFRNTCYRPADDKSPNGVLVDGTKAYPAGCFNLAKLLMTGKGGMKVDRVEAFKNFDRACRGGHNGACFIEAQILSSPPGHLPPGIPHDIKKATNLYQKVCDEGDSLSCYTLASMLLRGDKVSKEADNVTPAEARGEVPLATRENEPNRSRKPDEKYGYLPRDPKRAEQLLLQACLKGSHVTSCHNLAVMYTNGDDGIPVDLKKAEEFQKKTTKMVDQFGGYY